MISRLFPLFALALCGLAAPAPARVLWLDCQLLSDRGEEGLRFALDLSQFAPPVSSGEPPRRQVAQVQWRGEVLRADALLMQDGAVGFHLPGRAMMAMVQQDGAASLSIAEQLWTGMCRREQ